MLHIIKNVNEVDLTVHIYGYYLNISEAVWTRWLWISNSAKKMLRSLLFGAEDCQPECAANRPELESDPEQLELRVEHWKGLSEIEVLNARREVLLHLQQQSASGINGRRPPPHSHMNFVRDEHFLEYWQEGLRVLNEVIHLNSNDSHSHTYVRVRGGIQFLLGDFESALQDLDLAYRNPGGHQSTVLLERALVKCMLGRYSEAMQDVVAVIALNPNVNDIQELQACIQQIFDQQRAFRIVTQSGPSCPRPLLPDQDSSMVEIPDLLTGDEWHSGEIGSLRPIYDAGTAGSSASDPPSKRARSMGVARAADWSKTSIAEALKLQLKLTNYAQSLEMNPRYHVRRISFNITLLEEECDPDGVVKPLSPEDQELLNWQPPTEDLQNDLQVRETLISLSRRLLPYKNISHTLYSNVTDDDSRVQRTGPHPLSRYRHVSCRSAMLTKHSAADGDVQTLFLHDGTAGDRSCWRRRWHEYIKLLDLPEARSPYRAFWLVQWDVVDMWHVRSDRQGDSDRWTRPRTPADPDTADGQSHNAATFQELPFKSSAAASRTEYMTTREDSLVHSNVSNPSCSNLNVVGDAASSDTSSIPQMPLKRRIHWIIGLDFVTTFSGFAYARASDDAQINVHHNWPRKGNENAYCKTLTGLYYRKEERGSRWECSSWGYPARSEYVENRRNVDAANKTIYLTKFKLLLMRDLNDPALAASIPKPFTAVSIITDYLRLIGEHALDVVRNHHLGDHGFSKDLVQWVVTVPSIWDENAKQQMKVCMVDAGLVGLGGIDAVNVVLEPEAASFHCHEILRRDRKAFSLDTDDRILVADVGGGTVDIVVQEMIGNRQTFRVQELTESSGGLCGGTNVDESFLKFLSQKIPCLDAYLNEHPTYKPRLLKDCEEIKCSFGHELMSDTDTKDITLPNNLAMQWEAYESSRGHSLKNSSVVEFTHQDLTSIFDPVVDEILSLIAAQLAQVSDIKVMFLVGGFADSQYLRQRILESFEGVVTHIVSPPSPGSAIVQGAVSLGLHPEAIASRIARRTYGTSFTRPFQRGRDPQRLLRVTSGKEYCHNGFDVFVRKGDRVNVDMSLTNIYVPHTKDQKEMVFDIWSSSDKEPRYTAESESTTKEGAFAVPLTDAAGNELPRFEMTMSFGRGLIEVSAVGNVPGRTARRLVLPVKYCS